MSGTAQHLGWLPLPEPPAALTPLVHRTDALLTGWWRQGRRAALDDLITTWLELIAHEAFTTASMDFQLACHDRAGLAICWRAAEDSDPASLEAARVHLEKALRGHPAWIHDVRYHLAIWHYNRTIICSDEDGAHTAIGLLREVLDALPRDDTRLRPRCLDVLGRCMLRLRRSDTKSDLSETIALFQQSLASLSKDTPYRGMVASMTASALRDRYKITGRLSDLEQAIEVLRGDIPPQAFPSSAAFGASLLGILLRERYLRLRDPADLHEALNCHDRAVELTGPGHRNRPLVLTNQGNALLEAFRETDDTAFLERALEAQAAAVDATRPEEYFYPSRLNNWANSLSTAFELTGDRGHLDQAVDLYTRAIELAPPAEPDLPSRHYNLANALCSRHDLRSRRRDRLAATRHYREACRSGLVHSPEWALGAASAWGAWAGERGDWREAAEAYEFGVAAVEQLFSSQVSREHKETWLHQAQGLPAEAAYAFVRARRIEEAVLVQERSRALLLAEALRRLPDRAAPAASTAMAEVFDAAGRTPLVYLDAAARGGVALALDPVHRKVRALPLPEVTHESVRRRVDLLITAYRDRPEDPATWLGAVDSVGRWAQEQILGPVLGWLSRTVPDFGDAVTLVPTGRLSLLPLHAAWAPAPQSPGGRSYALDGTAISYVPTAQALIAGLHAKRTASSALVVDEPQPVSAPALPWSSVERAAVVNAVQHAHILNAGAATRAAVLAELGRHQLVHFSSHGIGRPDRPLESALLMADDELLTLRDIIEMAPSGAPVGPRLVVLSACETYQVGTDLPDEVVSFPTGLLQHGVAGVVATQWSVSSMAAALQVAAFYRSWTRGLPPAQALREAQCRLRRATNARLALALRPDRAMESLGLSPEAARPLWMALRRREPDAVPFGHPAVWAAFAYIGS